MKTIRIAAAQTVEFREDITAALNYASEVAACAENEGAALLCFPEGFLQGYLTDETLARRNALNLASPAFEAVLNRLPKTGPMVVMGLIEVDDGRLFNIEVWLAARLSSRGRGRESDARFRNLCRRLGFGLLGVLPNGEVEVLVSPIAPMPHKNTRRRSRLVEEHRRRRGDPAEGGGSRAHIASALWPAPPRWHKERDVRKTSKRRSQTLTISFIETSMAGSSPSSEGSTT